MAGDEKKRSARMPPGVSIRSAGRAIGCHHMTVMGKVARGELELLLDQTPTGREVPYITKRSLNRYLRKQRRQRQQQSAATESAA